MPLQGRPLNVGLQGADVRATQFHLRLLGFAIPDAEINQGSFADGTLKAVVEFQAKAVSSQ